MNNLKEGDLISLEVVDIKEFGAFLNRKAAWKTQEQELEQDNQNLQAEQPAGLEEDILLPEKEMTVKVKKGQNLLLVLKTNPKSGKLFASMKVYDHLLSHPDYEKNQVLPATVIRINKDLGVFVAVEDKYHGLILKKELYEKLSVGDQIEVRIINIREDGKLEVTTRQPAHLEMEDDARKLLDYLKENDGWMDLNDNSSPEEIREVFGISKKAFKRAAGRLLKEGAIKLEEEGISLNWAEPEDDQD